MTLRVVRDELLSEVMAFLRAETTPRREWRKRAWLGRRAAFACLEDVVLAKYWTSTRSNDEARHLFVAMLLEALENIGALDLLTAGRWAERELADPVDETRPHTSNLPRGVRTAADYVAWIESLNKRR